MLKSRTRRMGAEEEAGISFTTEFTYVPAAQCRRRPQRREFIEKIRFAEEEEGIGKTQNGRQKDEGGRSKEQNGRMKMKTQKEILRRYSAHTVPVSFGRTTLVRE